MLAYCDHECPMQRWLELFKQIKCLLHNIHVTDPFLTVTSWFLELCTRDRPISHVKNTIFCSPDPWQPHFSPWQVGFWRSVHVTDLFLTSKIPYFVAQIRDNPISHRDEYILLAQHPWQTHFSTWQFGFWRSVHVTDPFLTSKISYFVAQIRDRPISHRDKSILSAQHPWQNHFSPWQVVFRSSVHATDPETHAPKTIWLYYNKLAQICITSSCFNMYDRSHIIQ